jgi:2-methylisocitrate lyase-like PEP mutase family enzyme
MATQTQAEKGRAFRSLHEGDSAFLLPNPWNPGTARLLAQMGFAALASTSAGSAFSLGQRDNTVGREKSITHLAEIAAATVLPVSGDLGNGFGNRPEDAAETITLAAEAGLVGGSIEDATGRQGDAIFAMAYAADRVRAAAEAARALPFPFTLTARAENFLHARRDLQDTIRRLQAYQEAGADVLYAPGLTSVEEIRAVVSSVDRPVNVLMGIDGCSLTLADLSAVGVKRVSVGSALARAALGAFLRAAEEMASQGTFRFARGAVSSQDINAMFVA